MTRRNKYLEKISEIELGLSKIKINGLPSISTDFELFFPRQPYPTRNFNLLATPLIKNGKIIGYVIIIKDISDKRDAERSLQQKTKYKN